MSGLATIPAPVVERGAYCLDEERRGELLRHPSLNGIDFIEYRRDATAVPVRHFLDVHFVKPLPDPPHSGADEAYGLTGELRWIGVHGGVRVTPIRVLRALRDPGTDFLTIEVAQAGDFSIYWLTLGWVLQPDGHWVHVIANLDPRFSLAPVNFRAGCPVEVDCRRVEECVPERAPEPPIDYLAKDYASLRRLLLDVLAQRDPGWRERNVADLGLALIELFAYTGDYLSYFQDAVANEASLDTARQRVSAKRHARLVDYRMHDGRNAWTPVHFAVGTAGIIPQRARLLTKITRPLAGGVALPGRMILAGDLGFIPLVSGTGPGIDVDPAVASLRGDPALQPVRVFETAHPVNVDPLNNEIRIHTWGDLACCLPRGTTSAYLYAVAPGAGGDAQAVRPPLSKEDFLLFEEVLSPDDGTAAAADRTHRAVVRITAVESVTDPLFSATLGGGELVVSTGAGDELPLLHVLWDRTEAFAFPLCVSSRTTQGTPIARVAVARGNIALADHGLTIREVHRLGEPVEPDARFQLRLAEGPLTLQCPPRGGDGDWLEVPRTTLDCGAAEAIPAVALSTSAREDGGAAERCEIVPTLLDSGPLERHVVADVGNDGGATLRFGDGEYGREAAGARHFDITYRIGNGAAGNIGAEGLHHLVVHPTPGPWPLVTIVRNPLEARDGTDAETIEQVRQYAPAAFHAVQFRAVTAADYAAAADAINGVAGAVGTFRWTGSWHTVFAGVDPSDEIDLVRHAGGYTRLAPPLERRVRAELQRRALAGYDLEIRTAQYVPLEIELEVCVLPDHFRGEVVAAVRRALRPGRGPDGAPGFFDPSRLTFGQPVYLSALYAAVDGVPGVDSAVVTVFQRYGRAAAGELEAGVLPIGAWEIARLSDDPSAVEDGVLCLIGRGGK